MAIFQLRDDSIEAIPSTSFSALGIKERDDLQRLLRDQVEIIAPDTLIISEEFSDWSESKRRIDLLGVDRDANLVVIELKRTEDGGHMDLQAVRYAAMVSTMTFDQAIEIFEQYLSQRNDNRDARDALTSFLDWDENQESSFGEDSRIVLVSADFSKELTTSVLWLRDRSVDIRCIRIRPYENDGKVLLDVQQVVPLPEAEDYQIRVQRKAIKDRAAKSSTRDLTRYDVKIGNEVHERLPKRRLVLQVVSALITKGVCPDELAEFVTWRYLFFKVEGQVDGDKMVEAIIEKNGEGNIRRWFVNDEELIHHNDATYAMCNQWGTHTIPFLNTILEKYDTFGITYRPSD